MNDIEIAKGRVLKKASLLKWGVGLVGALVLAPVVWALVYAVLGAAALGASLFVAGAVGLAVVNLAPVLSMKFANWKINMIIEEAQRNPIPTLIQEYDKDGKELEGFQQAIVDYATEIGNVRDQAAKLQSYLTQSDREKFESDIALMEKDLQLQEQDLDEFKQQHEAFRVEIQRADAIWKLNMAVSKANAKNRGVRAEETIARIKKDTALDAVSSAMNRSKAQLRQRIRDRTVVQLTDQSSPSMGGYEKLFGDADKGDRQAAMSSVFAMPYGKDKQ